MCGQCKELEVPDLEELVYLRIFKNTHKEPPENPVQESGSHYMCFVYRCECNGKHREIEILNADSEYLALEFVENKEE